MIAPSQKFSLQSKILTMKTKLATLGLLIAFSHSLSRGEVPNGNQVALNGQRLFTTPAAANAQQTYGAALATARSTYSVELEKAMKAALASADLEEANAIRAARQTLTTAAIPPTGQVFKTSLANQALRRFEAAVSAAQKVYARDLTTALKAAMAAGNLDESNGINSEIKAILTVAAAPASKFAPKPIGQPSQTSRGVSIVRYPVHPTQSDNYTGNIDIDQMGKPKGAARTLKSISPWTKEKDENAVVSGYIRIDQPGTYTFRTRSDFDRNELIIDGQVVCKFRDGENKPGSIELTAGLVPFISVGYALATTFVMVEWMPPGQADWDVIPSNLLSH